MPNNQLFSDLALLATVEDELGIAAESETTRLARYIAAASDAIRRYLNRQDVHFETGIVEKFAGYGSQRIVVSRPNLEQITSITVDGAELNPDEYEIEDYQGGVIYRRYGFPWTGLGRADIVQEDRLPGTQQKLITVTYDGGWVTPYQADQGINGDTQTLPFDIEEACIQTVVSMYRSRGQDRNIVSESLGSASVSYGGVNSAIGRGAGGIIPDSAAALLNPYRRIAL
jgi:hypothetical protein